jgi:phytoene synthase
MGMHALYAFLRHTDDLADEPGDPAIKRKAIEDWREQLELALAGDADAASRWPGMPALAETVRRYGIPPAYLKAAIEGVLMDVEPRLFTTFHELERYCEHVASAVGLACLHIWGFRSENGRAEELARECGIALQLTNILRDVHEDAASGRVYLPVEDLERFGVDPRDFAGAGRRPSEAMRRLFAFEAERALGYYAASEPLEGLVLPEGRPMLRAVVGIYRRLLEEIIRRGYDVLDRRISVPIWSKLWIAFAAMRRREIVVARGRDGA